MTGEELTSRAAAGKNLMRGGPDAPPTRAGVEAKFRGNAGLVLPPAQVDAAIRAVEALATGAPLADLVASLTPERKGS